MPAANTKEKINPITLKINTMKQFLLAVSILLCTTANAQVSGIKIQASGLTCSMCSKAINKSLENVTGVNKVEPDIAQSAFNISFKPDATVDFDVLRKAVENAGFFVAKFYATIQFDNTAITPDAHIAVGNRTMHFVNVSQRTLNGTQTIRIIDKGFVSAKEYKKNSQYTKMECYKTGVSAGACCKSEAGSRIFHVTL